MKRLIVLLLACLALSACGTDAPTGAASEPTAAAPEFATVNGRVVPLRTADLSFQVDGQIAEWLADPGAAVDQGQPLARIDTRLLEIRVRQAEAALLQGQSALERTKEGATEAEIAAAAAGVDAAKGQLQATSGAVTSADVAAARARVTAARETLNKLLAGPKSDVLQAGVSRRDQAEAALKQAQAVQQTTATDVSAAKVRAETALADASHALELAQARYTNAYWQNEKAQAGTDPLTDQALNDHAKLQYTTALKAAEEALATSEQEVERAKLALEQARKNEISANAEAAQQVASARAELASAERALQELIKGADRADLAGARAELADAQAALDRLTGAQQAGNVAAARGNVAAAEARLEQTRQGPKASEIAQAQANVAVLQAQLDEARLRLNLATLLAPFKGTVGQHLSEVGEQVGAGKAVLSLGDDTAWRVETDDLSELEVGGLKPGQEFKVAIDALDGREFTAKLVRVNPQPTIRRGETSYVVVLDLPVPADAPVRWGMTARVQLPLRRAAP